jgi:hypothetical protein
MDVNHDLYALNKNGREAVSQPLAILMRHIMKSCYTALYMTCSLTDINSTFSSIHECLFYAVRQLFGCEDVISSHIN